MSEKCLPVLGQHKLYGDRWVTERVVPRNCPDTHAVKATGEDLGQSGLRKCVAGMRHCMRCFSVPSGSFKAPQECRAMLARATTEQSCRSRFQPESSPSGTLCSPLNRSQRSRRRQQNSFRTSHGQAAHANAASLLNSGHGQGQPLEWAPSLSGHRWKGMTEKGTGGVGLVLIPI